MHREVKENLETTSVSSCTDDALASAGAMFREGMDSFGKPGAAEAEYSVRGMGGYGKGRLIGVQNKSSFASAARGSSQHFLSGGIVSAKLFEIHHDVI